MKRIFSILAIVCLLVALAVPAFASDYVRGEGTWSFNENLGDYTYPKTFVVAWSTVHPSSGLITGTKIVIQDNSNQIQVGFFNGNSLSFYITYDMNGKKSGSNGYWSLTQGMTIYADTDTAVYEWLTANATYTPPPKCTGESCPATDVNMDNVCDDCGMTFAVLRQYAPPSGWPANVPTPPAQYVTMILLTENEQTWLYMVDEPVNAVITDPTDYGERVLTLSFSANNTVQRYRLSDGEWSYSSVNSLRSFNFDQTLEFDYSNVDIFDMYGNPFFPLPLWAEMGQVTQGEMSGLTATTDGTILTLVLCGVGLMALLVVLNLFGKRSLIYRK